jgi:ribosomal protein S18 acetylase RimI-like enzyme
VNLRFRAARAEDVDAAVPLIHASGPEAFDYVFSVRAAGESQEFLHAAFRRGRGRFGWRNHVVACDDERIVGIGTGYGAERNAAFFLADAAAIARFHGLRAAGVAVRALRAEHLLPPPRAGEWMLAHIAVAPDQRGGGVGARLLNHLIEQGRQAGKATAVLDVSVENPRAEALYRRFGFELIVERTSSHRSRHGRLLPHRRMALRLDRP